MLILLFLLTLFSTQNTEQQENYIFNLDSLHAITIDSWTYAPGDSTYWATLGYDDSHWEKLETLDLKEFQELCTEEIIWLRFKITLSGRLVDYESLSFYFRALSNAYEVYFDGHLIQRNGKIQLGEPDEVGTYSKYFRLPYHLTLEGDHVVAIRLSEFTAFHPEQSIKQFGYHSSLIENLNLEYYYDYFAVGMYLFTMVICFGMYIGGGKKSQYIFFALTCCSFAFDYTWRTYIRHSTTLLSDSITFTNYFFRVTTFVQMTFTNLFILHLLNIPYRKKLTIASIGIALITVTTPFYLENITPYAVSTILLCFYAIYLKRVGSIAATFSVSLSLLIIEVSGNFIESTEFSWTPISLSVGLFFFMVAISQRIKLQTDKTEEIKLRSSRLELELLKVNIQPHFLLNTLLSIISWIERRPKVAVELIQSLASQFRIVLEISGEKLIPLDEELELCETHLKTMGIRKDSSYKIVKENIDLDDLVPPLIFHTLVENGLTHSFISGEDGEFYLSCKKTDRSRIYTLRNGGSLLEEMTDDDLSNIDEGFGTKYIKSRLEESFPQKWRMSYGIVNTMWQVDIEIDH